jgi:anti-sigma-K factor RskA
MTDRDRHDEKGNGNGSGDDTETLLGAYVLGAVDDVERRRVERLLETDPADLLGSLMARVADRATDGRSDPSGRDVVVGGSGAEVASLEPRAGLRRPRAPWILSAAAVVILFVVGAVVVTTRHDDGVTDSAAAMQKMAAEAASMPGSRTGALTDAENTMAVQVIVDPDGHAFVMSGVLPALDSAHTYQLWSVDGGTPVSLGLLGSDPTMSVVGVDSQVHTLAITMEPMGGSAGPTTTPMASGTLNTV